MQRLKKEKREMVRIIVGACETGQTGFKKPTRSITLINTDVNQVYALIEKAIEEEIK